RVEPFASGPALLRDGSVLSCTDHRDIPINDRGTILQIPVYDGGRICRANPNGRLAWQTFLDGKPTKAIALFPLVRFGFPSKANVDTAAFQTRALKSADVLARRYAAEKLQSFPIDDAIFAAAADSLRDKDSVVRRHAMSLAAKSPERC